MLFFKTDYILLPVSFTEVTHFANQTEQKLIETEFEWIKIAIIFFWVENVMEIA
jgi:hypothetical protein